MGKTEINETLFSPDAPNAPTKQKVFYMALGDVSRVRAYLAVVKQAFLAIYGHLAHLGRLTVYVHLLKKIFKRKADATRGCNG